MVTDILHNNLCANEAEMKCVERLMGWGTARAGRVARLPLLMVGPGSSVSFSQAIASKLGRSSASDHITAAHTMHDLSVIPLSLPSSTLWLFLPPITTNHIEL